MTNIDLGADDGLDQLAARAAEVSFSRDDLDRIAAVIFELAADPEMEGYVLGYPTWGLVGSHDIDVNIAATSTCPKCGRYGRGHAGFVAADGSHSWRGFAICPACDATEEF